MTKYVTCPTCGRQTTARKARSHQQACKRQIAYCVLYRNGYQPWKAIAEAAKHLTLVPADRLGAPPQTESDDTAAAE